jgi:glycosyltransferase involved in cell wall biosynthesis
MLNGLIRVVPFGLSASAPSHDRPALRGVVPGIDLQDEIVLWGGGIYNWFDPLTLIKSIDKLRHRRPNVRLFFMGLRHPNPVVKEMEMSVDARALADILQLTGRHVFFNEDWIAYGDRQNYLLEADIGVTTHLIHLEAAYSFRTRILDYIWAGLPIVATTGDSFAELIDREQLGLTVPATDVDRLEEALYRLLDDQELASVCRTNLDRVRPQYAWTEVLRPLVEFCRAPRRAPDLARQADTDVEGVAGGAGARGSQRWTRDARTAVDHFRAGGIRQVVRKAKSRLGHKLIDQA